MLGRHAASISNRRGVRTVTTIIYFDAFYRRETGEIYTAVVCEDHSELTYENLLATSSGHAEWLAALSALEYAMSLCEEIGGVEWEWMSTDDNPAGKFIRRKQAAGAMRTKGLWG
jgi:hypothetical protein